MKASILDSGLVTIIKSQLQAARMSWLTIVPYADRDVCGHNFAIFSATLCNKEGAVFNAWIVSGGPGGQFPYGGIYNQDNYPSSEEAVAQQIGQLVLNDGLKILGHGDGKRTRKK